MEQIAEALLSLAASPWIYLVALVVAAVDGFFPPMPSETIVVAAAAIGAATGTPHAVLIGLAAALGAFAGDNLTYLLGRRIGTDRFRWMRGGRASAAIGWARRSLEQRGTSLILIARYIPVGRIAVNLTAGATGYPRRRFVAASAVAAVTWAAYSVAIGTIAGVWFEANPLVGAAIGVALALLIGIVIDRVSARRRARREPAEPAAAELATVSRG